MKHHILLATTALFAAKANAIIEKSPHALVLGDATLAGHGHVTALFTADPTGASRNGTRTLLSVQVLEGSPKKVAEELEALTTANPYVRPLRVLGSVIAIEQKDESAPEVDAVESAPPAAKKAAKKAATKNAKNRPAGGDFARSIIAIVGTFQP